MIGMDDWYDKYGEAARAGHDATMLAGRLDHQGDAEALIFSDVVAKIGPLQGMRYFEIGCGPGAILVQAARHAEAAFGMDHPDVLKHVPNWHEPSNITLIPGRFPDARPEGSFDRVVAYSVLHCLPSEPDAIRFMEAAAALLAPGGSLLFGDLPNADLKARFLASPKGHEVHSTWLANPGVSAPELSGVQTRWRITDSWLMERVSVFRADGYEAYVLPQSPALPFGWTREDLLVRRHA